MTLNFNGIVPLLLKTKEKDPDTYHALHAIHNALVDVRKFLKISEDKLNSTGDRGEIASKVFPSASNAPPKAGTGTGNTFFNTSRKRHAASVDTWEYYDFPTPESCRVTHSVNQVTATGVMLTLAFDTDVFNHFKLHDTVTNNTRITIPLDGRYLVGGEVVFEANAVARRRLQVIKNGATEIASASEMAITDAAIVTRIGVSTVYEFVTGDYVELVAFQASGGNLNVTVNAEFSPIFYCHRLG